MHALWAQRQVLDAQVFVSDVRTLCISSIATETVRRLRNALLCCGCLVWVYLDLSCGRSDEQDTFDPLMDELEADMEAIGKQLAVCSPCMASLHTVDVHLHMIFESAFVKQLTDKLCDSLNKFIHS